MAKESPLIANFGKGQPAKSPAPVAVAYKAPTPVQRMKDSAHDARVSATRQWVAGEISSKKHSQIHSRASRVLKGKAPGMKPKGR